MSKKNANPYNENTNYGKLFGVMKKKQLFTRQDIMDAASELEMSETGAAATVTVLLSPRETDGRGDCRGNMSAQGHVYYVEKMKRKTEKVTDEDGNEKTVKLPQKFRLRYRKEILEPRKRTAKVTDEVEQKKTETVEPAEPVEAVEPETVTDEQSAEVTD